MAEEDKTSDDAFLKERILFMDGGFTEERCNKLARQILYLSTHEGKKPVMMYISSSGGYVNELSKLMSLLKAKPFHLTTIALGKAHSAAAVLLLCGDKRIAYPETSIWLHECAYDNGYEKLHDHVSVAKGFERQQKEQNKWIASRTKIKDVDAFMKEEQILTPQEALKLGIIHEVRG